MRARYRSTLNTKRLKAETRGATTGERSLDPEAPAQMVPDTTTAQDTTMDPETMMAPGTTTVPGTLTVRIPQPEEAPAIAETE